MTRSTPSLPYRPHLDGLRAIAVLSVVLYHAGVPGISGGFVGVDVFFVISGYLITALLVRELEASGDISLRRFAMRRIRRLAPALFVVLLATLVAGMVVLSPINGEQQGLAKSAIATLGLVANVYFWQHSGYFQAAAESQPLLHLWSLSVEEQFYLAWPWLILGAAALAPRLHSTAARTIALMIAVVFLASLLACVLVTPMRIAAAFYLTPFRAWEFAAGGAVMFLLRNPLPRPLVANALALIGLAGVLGAVAFLKDSMLFPGSIAVLPVLAAALLIYGCEANPVGVVPRLLSLRAMVFIGVISYSLYLWHWPLLAIARVATLGQIGAEGIAALCVLATILAWLSYRYIEEPVRRGKLDWLGTPRRVMAMAAGASALLLAVAGGVGLWAKHVWPRIPGNRAFEQPLTAMEAVDTHCLQFAPFEGLLPAAECTWPVSARPLVLVWGDSHAEHFVPAISRTQDGSTGLMLRAMAGCPAHLQVRAPASPPADPYEVDCVRFNRQVLATLPELRRSGLRTLVLAAHWRDHATSPAEWRFIAAGLDRVVESAEALGLDVLVVAQVPDHRSNLLSCLIRATRSECGVSRAQEETARRLELPTLQGVVSRSRRARLVDPVESMCSAAECSPQPAWDVLYSDMQHLSVKGSESLAPLFIAALPGTSEAAR